MIYFTSDWHFGHKSILKFERFDFDTIEDHDMYIIDVLYKTLKPKDILYFLGDVGFPSKKIEKAIRDLPCAEKYIILGNHDAKSIRYYKEVLNFKEVYNHPVFLGQRIVLSHIPIKVNDSVINIHGHLHGAKLDLKNYINVSFEVANKTLLSYKKVTGLLNEIPKENNEFLHEWFADHYQVIENIKEKRNDLLLDDNNKIIGFTIAGLNSPERFQINKRNLINREIITTTDNKIWKVIDYEGFCAIGMNNGEIKKIPLDTIGRILAIDERI